MRTNRITIWPLAVVAVLMLIAVACSEGSDEPLDPAAAEARLQEVVDDTDWRNDPVTRTANVNLGAPVELSETLPPIDEYPLMGAPSVGANGVVAEVFVSTEKSGEGTDGWMVEVADAFNSADQALADGRSAKVAIRRIASGTGYQFIAAGQHLPDGFSPSNQLWVEMAATHETMTPVRDQLVPNVAGIVMKSDTADELRTARGTLDAATLIEAVIAGDVVMGYTDPFASSTGLNFLLTVLDAFAEGQEDRLVAPDVASVFEEFQRRVPFVALTTLQIRDSVERDNGTLDAFVMEYQTFVKTESLQSGFEFIPFGVAHDNPLYAVGDPSSDTREVLELFAAFADRQEYQDLAREFGFDPPQYSSDVAIPSGETLIQAQQLWKDKKDGGRPVAAVFVTDVSGSMDGSKILAVQQALLSAREFIAKDNAVGLVEFSDEVVARLPVAEFDLIQQGKFVAAAEDMTPAGGTAMYDGVAVGLSMLLEQRETDPNAKLLLFVLTDGATNEGHTLDDVDEMIAGLRIPVYTVGFEADLDELAELASLVEAASINASLDDVEFKIASLFNAGV